MGKNNQMKNELQDPVVEKIIARINSSEYPDTENQMVVDTDTVRMMVEEAYEYTPKYDQESSLYQNVCILAESHERLRALLHLILAKGVLCGDF